MVLLRMTTVYNRVDTVINGALEERPSANGFQSTEQDSQSTKIHTLNQKKSEMQQILPYFIKHPSLYSIE